MRVDLSAKSRTIAVALLAALAAMGLLAGSHISAQAPPVTCGADREDVKTLSDPSVGNIDLTRVIGVNISTLASVPVPDSFPAESRYDPFETTIYTTTADLIEARLQPNGDIAVVIEDGDTGTTMTAAFPDAANCAHGADPRFVALMEQARSAFIQAFGTPTVGTPLPLSGTAQVTGVGFLDPVLGQDGEAASGLEFNPVLDFEPADGTGSQQPPSATSTPAPTASIPAIVSATPAPGAPQTAHRYYVDTASSTDVIYCDSDPAIPVTGRQYLVVFQSLGLATAAYPGYRLNSPC